MKSLLVIFFALTIALHTSGQTAAGYIDNLEKPNGPVYAMTKSGNTLYVGGDFTRFEWKTQGWSMLDTVTGRPVVKYKMSGLTCCIGVYACVPDGSGGWYIAGNFTTINGQTRNRLARLNADGSLHPWNPVVSGGSHPIVNCMIQHGNTLYVGGTFDSVSGVSRNCLAAFDITTGTLTNWHPGTGMAIASINCFAASAGVVYVGGDFWTMPGYPQREDFAALDSATGNITPLTANTNIYYAQVYSLLLSGNSLYICGAFPSLNGLTRNSLAAIDIPSGTIRPWNPCPIQPVNAIGVVSGMTMIGANLFISGSFDSVGYAHRQNMAAIDTATGLATSWSISNFLVGGFVTSRGGKIYASQQNPGGPHLRIFDATTGAETGWSEQPDFSISCIGFSGGNIFFGGGFTSVGQTRSKLAAIDLTSGRVTAWAPQANNTVYSLLFNGDKIYAGGSFTTISGASQKYLAAIDTTGSLTSWNPNVQISGGSAGTVKSMVIKGSQIYFAGAFDHVGLDSRKYLAAADLASGGISAWNPIGAGNQINGYIYTLAIDGNTIYTGGSFSSIAGQTRYKAAAFDATTGSLLPWNPDVDHLNYSVQKIIVKDSIVYLGGSFRNVGGVSRKKVAAVDKISGGLYPWHPNISVAGSTPSMGFVSAMFASDNTLYVGGSFTDVSGSVRNNLAAFNCATGDLTTWSPSSGGVIQQLFASGDTVFVGGSFSQMEGDTSRHNFVPIIDSNNLTSFVVTSVSPNNNLCRGANITVTFNSTPKNPGNSFIAQLSNGAGNFANPTNIGTLNATTGGTINAVIPLAGPTGTHYKIRIISTSLADTSENYGYDIVINAAPTAAQTTVSPATIPPLCSGDTIVLSVPPTPGFTYQWFKNSIAVPAATNSTYTVNNSGIYNVVVTQASGCQRSSASKNITIAQLNGGFTITTFTNGNKKLLASEPQAQYQWYLNGGTIAGATTQTYLATVSGAYHVVVTKAGCTVIGTPAAITISPLNIVAISPSNNFCKGANAAITFTASGITAGNIFTAQLSDTSGSFATPYNIGTLASTTGGTMNVTITDTASLGSHYRIRIVSSAPVHTSPDNGYNITLQPKPTVAQIAVTPAGAQAVCSGSSVVLAVPNTPGYSYQWKLDSMAIPYATANSFPASLAGGYTVAVTTQYGCVRSSVNKTVTIKALPSASFTVTQLANGNKKLTAAEPLATYQWYMNTVAIPGASQKNYTATVNGDYYVAVTKNGCTATGNPVAIIVGSAKPSNGIATTARPQTTMSIYPNPTSGNSNILLHSDKETAYKIIISDVTGRKVLELHLANDSPVSFGETLSPGAYIIEATGPEGKLISKWVKE